MNSRAMSTLIASVFSWAAFGQDTSRVFNFSGTDTVQDIQEVATVIRVIAGFENVAANDVQKSLELRGALAQIALGEWLFNELDKPANRLPLAQQRADPATHEYRVEGGGDNVVRVFYPRRTTTLQEFQEVAVLVRSIADIRRVFTYSAPRALVIRGTADQAALAEWLVNTMDATAAPAKLEYKMPGGGDDVVRVFYLAHTDTLQSFQEVATLVRSIGDIRRVFTYNAPRAIAMRGTADQAALAEWLFGELDKLVKDSAAHEYRMSGTAEDVVRVFYLPHSGTLQHFQEIATFVRRTTQIRRAFTYNAPRALTLRGTAAQIAQASQLIQERDKP